jgi:hypothetical protein
MRRVPTVGGVTLVVALISGMMLGATMAAEDTERVDVGETMRDDLFTDDGQINTTDTATSPQFGGGVVTQWDNITPDTPQLDRGIRQTMVKPLLVSMIWVADVSSRIGYTMATTIGVGATKFVLQSAVVTMLAGAAYRVYQLARGVVEDV